MGFMTPDIPKPKVPRRETPEPTKVDAPVPEDGGQQARKHQRRSARRSGRSALRIPSRGSRTRSGVNTSYG